MSATAPQITEPLRFSGLNTFHDCGEKYRLRYVERVPEEPQGALIGGRIVHRSIEEAERQGWHDEDSIEERLLGYFHDTLTAEIEEAGGPEAIRWAGRKTREFPNGEDAPWWHKNGEFMLRRYLDTHGVLDERGIRVAGTEMRILRELPSGQMIQGTLDAFVAADENGEPVILDWKTGQVGRANVLQLATYAWLLEPAGYVVERGVIVFLRAADAARRFRWFNLGPLKPLVPARFDSLAKRLESGLFEVNPDAWHESCSVKGHCAYYAALVEAEGGAP